jgi:hypothetical protein
MEKLQIINLSNYIRPEIKEVSGKKWVLNGKNNEFYQTIIDAYNGSPTNSAIIDSYSQFIYGCFNLPNLHICVFSKGLFLTGSNFDKFREKFFEKYYLCKGFIMNSNHFQGVQSWPLFFSILKRNENV